MTRRCGWPTAGLRTYRHCTGADKAGKCVACARQFINESDETLYWRKLMPCCCSPENDQLTSKSWNLAFMVKETCKIYAVKV